MKDELKVREMEVINDRIRNLKSEVELESEMDCRDEYAPGSSGTHVILSALSVRFSCQPKSGPSVYSLLRL